MTRYIVTTKARRQGALGVPETVRFTIETSGGPIVASKLAIDKAYEEGWEHVDINDTRVR
jgi:hypothetical protein